jgi:hypothetical protein
MANLDTAAKRNSSLDYEEIWQWGAPLPDGTIGQGDRQHSIWSYSGIAFGAPGGPLPDDLATKYLLVGEGLVMVSGG